MSPSMPGRDDDELDAPASPLPHAVMSDTNRGSATVEVATSLIEQALHMPDDAEIIGAEMDVWNRTIRFRVASPALPGHLDGVNPSVTHHRERYEWDWNLPAVNGSEAVPRHTGFGGLREGREP